MTNSRWFFSFLSSLTAAVFGFNGDLSIREDSSVKAAIFCYSTMALCICKPTAYNDLMLECLEVSILINRDVQIFIEKGDLKLKDKHKAEENERFKQVAHAH